MTIPNFDYKLDPPDFDEDEPVDYREDVDEQEASRATVASTEPSLPDDDEPVF